METAVGPATASAPGDGVALGAVPGDGGRRRRQRREPVAQRARGDAAVGGRLAHQRRVVGHVAADVDLALAGVEARHGGDGAPSRDATMSSASACSDDTTCSGTPVGSARPLTVESPTRSPVKLPGPPPQAMPARSAGAIETARSASAHSGNTWLECRSAVASAAWRTPPAPSRIATRAVGVEVSRQRKRSGIAGGWLSTSATGSGPRRCAARAPSAPRPRPARRWSRSRARAATAAAA